MLTAVRDEVLRRADIIRHAQRAGFRRGRGRALHCGFHDDKHPSCSIRNNRVRCWGQCSRSWDVIDLEMAVTGATFPADVRQFAAEYGVAICDQTQDQRRCQRQLMEGPQVNAQRVID
jgi:DNA primase